MAYRLLFYLLLAFVGYGIQVNADETITTEGSVSVVTNTEKVTPQYCPNCNISSYPQTPFEDVAMVDAPSQATTQKPSAGDK